MRHATLAASTPNSGAGDFSRQSWLMCPAAVGSIGSGTIQLGSSPVEPHCDACSTLYEVAITVSNWLARLLASMRACSAPLRSAPSLSWCFSLLKMDEKSSRKLRNTR